MFRTGTGGRGIEARRGSWGGAASPPPQVEDQGKAPTAVDFEGFGTSQKMRLGTTIYCLASKQVNWNLVCSHFRVMAAM